MGVSLQIDYLIGTSAHAPQQPIVTYTGMGTVGLALMGCCVTGFLLVLFRNAEEAAVAEWYRYWIVAGFVHEFEPSTTKDPPCRAAMHAKSVES
ncbi:uncharacterized protein TNCV_724451 [Trichonephila clavipes]|nr:uncharacterized protein TNCV_724451 [Trichonephila clavipes]